MPIHADVTRCDYIIPHKFGEIWFLNESHAIEIDKQINKTLIFYPILSSANDYQSD